ncbi:hypothetical protein O0L34_g8597 [Tuta absoluta]|nr:hypothetical protein O0L34_g3327 [Tuta absoluta]KAJ2950355.1 hypothetical protein O0L34_g8597 [Tuta absoluta]
MRVRSKAEQPRSYFLTDGSNRVYRRNRRHLIKIEEVDVKINKHIERGFSHEQEKQEAPGNVSEQIDYDQEVSSSEDEYNEAQFEQVADDSGAARVGNESSPTSTGTSGADEDGDTLPEEGVIGRVYREAKRKAQERLSEFYAKK